MAESGTATKLIFGNVFDELEQPAVNVLLVLELSRWPFAHENERQMLQCLLFPGGDVSNRWGQNLDLLAASAYFVGSPGSPARFSCTAFAAPPSISLIW